MSAPVAPEARDPLLRELRRWKLASVVLASLLVLSLGVSALLATRPAPSPIAADDERRHRRRSSDDAPVPPTPRCAEDELVKRLRDAIEPAGWKVVSESRASAEGLVQLTLSATRDGEYVMLMVAEAKDETIAASLASSYASMGSRGWVSRREGRRVYTVGMVAPKTPGAASASASAVLDAILPPGR